VAFSNEFLFVNVRSISDQLIVNVGSSYITRLPILMPMAYQEFVFLIGEGDWKDSEGKNYVAHSVGNRMK
jgi:hypothetical protein